MYYYRVYRLRFSSHLRIAKNFNDDRVRELRNADRSHSAESILALDLSMEWA
jgi:hypothetical protein